jgi:hypothetical protein
LELISSERRNELFSTFKRDAFHLELRDAYAIASEDESFQHWLDGKPADPAELDRPWLRRMRSITETGKTVRRVRVVSEPISAYIRYEWEATPENLDAGEDIRWLPRNLVPEDVDFPYEGRDFWLFDDSLAAFGHFDQDGRSLGSEVVTDPSVVRRCIEVRDRLWLLAVPHSEYRPG